MRIYQPEVVDIQKRFTSERHHARETDSKELLHLLCHLSCIDWSILQNKIHWFELNHFGFSIMCQAVSENSHEVRLT
jgi:hypothetical protein